MLVVCAGVHRSGSTWLYNAVRLILIDSGKSVYGCFKTNYDPENKAEAHVVKAHKFYKELKENADFIFTCRRDLRDIVASAVRRGLIDESAAMDYLDEIIKKEYEPWKRHSNLEIVYEKMLKRRKTDYIKKLAEIMGIDNIDSLEIRDKIESLPIPQSEEDFDEEIQLHFGHITNGKYRTWKETLTEYTIVAIEIRYAKWLEKNGYDSPHFIKGRYRR